MFEYFTRNLRFLEIEVDKSGVDIEETRLIFLSRKSLWKILNGGAHHLCLFTSYREKLRLILRVMSTPAHIPILKVGTTKAIGNSGHS